MPEKSLFERAPENLTGALMMLEAFTRGRFDIWMLAGNHNAASRAIVLSKLVAKRMPQSKAGVNALREALYAAMNITGSCLAEKEDNFIAAAREHLAQKPVAAA